MGDGPLPKEGHLWFFFDIERWPSGSKPSDAGGAVVLFDTGATLEATAPPANLPERQRFPLCAVTLEAYDDIPDLGNEEWLDERLDPVQDVMELECELVTNGITFAQRRKEAERVEQLEPRARDWRLLLQVESDGNAKMMWGDAGRLYFWIREEDLRAARFDRTWPMFQCS
jgi:hypothetical protein